MCISVLETLGKLCGKKFTHYDRLFPIIRLWNLDKHRFLEALKSFKDIISLKKNITKWTIDSPDFQNLYDGILLMHLYELWKTIDIDLFTFFENCDYVAPLRAEARRYYRNQGLQVDHVDPFGRNLTEAVDSLTETQRNSFNDFIERVLSIRLVVRNIS